MGIIDQMLRLQEQYLELVRQARAVEADYKAFTDRHGTAAQRNARVSELKAQLANGITVKPGEHPDEYDARHNLRVEDGKRYWTNVRGCPSCERINDKYGRTAIRNEIAEIQQLSAEAYSLQEQIRAIWDRHRAVCEQFPDAENLLPSQYLRLDGTGRITATGPVNNFQVRGQLVLESGSYVDYEVDGKIARAVLDSSDQLVAYHLGDGNWTVMRVAARPRITTDKGWYSVMRQSGVIEMMIGPDGESTNTYPHVHVIHDPHMNQVRVVASRSSHDHSAPEMLTGDASGNEVNAAILRAIQQL
jgi:hypothetical protein